MRQSKSMPQHDVRIVDGAIRAGVDPRWQTLRWESRTLRDVPSCWVDLIVVVYS